MSGYALPIMALAVGFLAHITMRKLKTRVVRVAVGIPAMVVMGILLMSWMR